jgi:hypothetical protein
VCKSKQIRECPTGHLTVVPPTPTYLPLTTIVVRYKLVLDNDDSNYPLELLFQSSNGGPQPLPPAVANRDFTIVVGGNEFRLPTQLILQVVIVDTTCFYDLVLNLPAVVP